METRYFKGTSDNAMWRFTPRKPGEFYSDILRKWTLSIFQLEDVEKDPNATETDSEGNLTDR